MQTRFLRESTLQTELDAGHSISALRRFNNNLAKLPENGWSALLDDSMLAALTQLPILLYSSTTCSHTQSTVESILPVACILVSLQWHASLL